jgi:hypothetical protein
MQLPKISLPQYKITLPVSGDIVKYRPYTSGEGKILALAAYSDELEEKKQAMLQIIENCTGVKDATDLHPVDFQFLFLKLRAASNSSIVNVVFNITDCQDLECPRYCAGSFDIEKMEIINTDYVPVFPSRGNTYIVQINENIGMQIKKNTAIGDNDYITIFNSLVSVYDGDKLYPKSSVEFEEFKEFLDSMTPNIAEQLHEFYTKSVPVLQCNITGECEKCGKGFSEKVNGLEDFFG